MILDYYECRKQHKKESSTKKRGTHRTLHPHQDIILFQQDIIAPVPSILQETLKCLSDRKEIMTSRFRLGLSRLAPKGQFHLISSSAATRAADKPISPWYPVVGGFAITVAGGLKFMHDHLDGSEGLIRSFVFYRFAIPKYLEYRYHMFMKSPDEIWDKLDKETSKRGLEIAYELEGFYIKAGQMCATNVGGAFPEIWQDTMSVLQDQVPPQDFSVIKQIVKSELDFDKTFKSFEQKPIGSAAIGQVHRATLHDGTPVVVKVRYPNVERLLRGDIRTIKSTCAHIGDLILNIKYLLEILY